MRHPSDFGKFEKLDLASIKFLFSCKSPDQARSRSETDRIEGDYKRFLYLMWKYPEVTLVPSDEVDSFWHAHILDTEKYALDCQSIFGRFIHHFPYFGVTDREDALRLKEAAAKTKQLLSVEFGLAGMEDGIALCGGQDGDCSNHLGENYRVSNRLKVGDQYRDRAV